MSTTSPPAAAPPVPAPAPPALEKALAGAGWEASGSESVAARERIDPPPKEPA